VTLQSSFDAWTWVWDVEWIAAVVIFGVWYAWLSQHHRIPLLRRAFSAFAASERRLDGRFAAPLMSARIDERTSQ